MFFQNCIQIFISGHFQYLSICHMSIITEHRGARKINQKEMFQIVLFLLLLHFILFKRLPTLKFTRKKIVNLKLVAALSQTQALLGKQYFSLSLQLTALFRVRKPFDTAFNICSQIHIFNKKSIFINWIVFLLLLQKLKYRQLSFIFKFHQGKCLVIFI